MRCIMLLNSYTKTLRSKSLYEMPTYYKKRTRRGRRRPKLRRGRKLNIRKEIEKYMDSQTETKTFDTSAVLSVTDTGAVTTQPIPVKGTNSYNRIGDDIFIVSQYLKFKMYFPAVAPDASNVIRVMLLVDRACRGVAPAPADILQDMVRPLITPLNKATAGRFSVIFDKILYIMTPNHPTTFAKYFIKVKKHKKENFITNTGFVGDVNTFCYFLLTVSDSNAAGHPNLEYFWRLNYKDC